MDQIKTSLDEVIKQTLEKAKQFEPGSEERADILKELKELHAARIEELKMEQARKERIKDERVQSEQMHQQRFERYLGYGLQVGLAIGSWIVYDAWFRRGLHFEMENTVASPWTRNLINKMLPKK